MLSIYRFYTIINILMVKLKQRFYNNLHLKSEGAEIKV